MAFPTTYATLYNAVIDKLRLDSTLDTTRAKDWVNQAYAQACLETEFYESSSASTALAAGATSVTIPAALIIVDYIVPAGSDGSSWGPMQLVSMQEILEKRAWSGGTSPLGAPFCYAYRQSGTPTIEFYPNASGGEVLTFYGAQLPTALSGDSDPTIFPEPYPKVVEYGALIQGAEYKQNVLMLQGYQSQYEFWLRRLRGYVNSRVGDKTQQLQVDKQRPWPRGNSVDAPYNY